MHLPDVGSSKPAIILSSVVLPQPDGPRREKNSPRPIEKSARSTATNDPNSLRTPSSTMTSPLADVTVRWLVASPVHRPLRSPARHRRGS